MEKSVPRLQWYGKPKFQYIVLVNCKEAYRCTSIAKNQTEVYETLIERFKSENNYVSIMCNGVIFCVINRSKIRFKSIL